MAQQSKIKRFIDKGIQTRTSQSEWMAEIASEKRNTRKEKAKIDLYENTDDVK